MLAGSAAFAATLLISIFLHQPLMTVNSIDTGHEFVLLYLRIVNLHNSCCLVDDETFVSFICLIFFFFFAATFFVLSIYRLTISQVILCIRGSCLLIISLSLPIQGSLVCILDVMSVQ